MFKTIFLLLAFQNPTPSDTIPLIDANQILEEVAQLMADEQYSRSIDLLQQVSPYDSNYLRVQDELISALAANEQLEEAWQLGETLMEARTDLTSSIYITVGNLYLNHDRAKEGMEVYQKGLEHFPYNHILLYNLGYGHYLLDEYEEAVSYMQQVLRINPFYSSAHSVLASIMAWSNQRTKATLGYLTYLMINSDQNWALVRLNNLLNDAYRSEGSIRLDLDNSLFSGYDDLLRSKAALDDRFRTAINFEAPVVQQSELLLSQLQYVPGTGDFWMDFYVPVFRKIREGGYTEPFLYFTLYSTEDEDVNEYLEKHQQEKEAWVDLASEVLTANKRAVKRTILGKERVYTHWYFDSGVLNAIGAESGDNNVGPYHFYHNNGRLSAIGEYNDEGKKIGVWRYYHDNGQLKSEEPYDDAGDLTAKITRYNREGEVEEIGHFKNGQYDGMYEWYYPCGTLSERYPYQEGIGVGVGEAFYETGELKARYGVKDSKLEGDYTYYHKNGQVQRQYTNVAGEADGTYRSYYLDGQLEQEGEYQLDKAQGIWLSYFSNGQLSDSGTYVDDHRSGEWLAYFRNGQVKRQENYGPEGHLQGELFWYDWDGKLHSERMYRQDTLIGYKYFDKQGNILFEASDAGGNMPYKDYYPTGQLNIETTLVDGDFQGLYTQYYVNGRIYQQGTMKAGSWDGVHRKYNDRGVLVVETTYEEGDNTGYYRSFFEDGTLQQQGWVTEGKSNQRWEDYFPNGELQTEAWYDQGKGHGEGKEFDVKGRLVSTSIKKQGISQSAIYYDSLGQVSYEVDIQNDQPFELRNAAGEVILSTTKRCGENVDGLTGFFAQGIKSYHYDMEHSAYQRYTGYGPDQQVITQGAYLNDQPHGTWNYYDVSGQQTFADEFLLGVSEGKVTFYHENGAIESVCDYSQGSRHGSCEYYDPSGNLQIIKHYKYDYGVVGYQYLLSEGTLSDTFLIAPQARVAVRAFYQSGEPSVSQDYDQQNIHGESTYFFKNGQPADVATYDNGMRVKKQEYYENGQLKREAAYEVGELHGVERTYYLNGQLKETTDWAYGTQDGWHRFYDTDGSLKHEFFYRNGQIY